VNLPLRVRLTLAFAVGMALVLSALGAFVYWRVGQDLLASVDLSLRARAQIVVAGIHTGTSGIIESSGSLIDSDESFAQVLDATGHVVAASSPALSTPLLARGTLGTLTGPRFLVRVVPRIDVDPIRLLVVPLTSSAGPGFVVVGGTLGDRRDALDRLLVAMLVGGPVALALTSLAGWRVAGGALRPVERMRREADAISVSEPARRLPVPQTGDELARLGATLNSMLDRLQEAFERERRFVDDASHELRTPLSILKMELDLALGRSRTPEELEAALRNASLETDRLVHLAEDLLVLARAERGRLPLRRTEVSLGEFLAQAVAAFDGKVRAAGARIDLEVESGPAWVDPTRLRQAVENLVENALRHSGPGGVIRIRAARSDDAVTISVEDSGPGFPEDLLPRVFEPFARSDSPVSEDGVGAGLGLTIVRAVAEAHGGTARAENVPLGGARITIGLRRVSGRGSAVRRPS
jgi:heavy metal sensor kinase